MFEWYLSGVGLLVLAGGGVERRRSEGAVAGRCMGNGRWEEDTRGHETRRCLGLSLRTHDDVAQEVCSQA